MEVLRTRFGVTERRACRVVGQHRSTQRLKPRPPAKDDAKLRSRLREIAQAHPRYGWKMAHRLLVRENWTINRKRVQRVWRDEGLTRPANTRKRRRQSPNNPERLVATEPNTYRPHSALGGLTPSEFFAQWTTDHQPALSQ